MKNIQELERNWEGFAQTDPLWAILSDPSRKGGKWTLQEFFEAGVNEISTMIRYLNIHGIKPRPEGCALDFGCGVGRLTQALVRHFKTCVGVDISSTMIARAKEINNVPQQCGYVVNQRSDLKLFETNQFDFIYSSIVLQHIDPAYSQEYVREFIRVLKPGGYAVFQIPDSIKEHIPPLQERLSNSMANIRVKLALRNKLHCIFPRYIAKNRQAPPALPSDEFQMDMHCVPESTIRRIVCNGNAKVEDVVFTTSTAANFNGHLQYSKREPMRGMISKQYCVSKESAIPETNG